MLGFMLVGAGCIIFPVPSVTPDYTTGVFDNAKLDSLIGLDQDAVMREIGSPDFSGPRGSADVMVYQGEKRYSTEVYAVVAAPYAVGGGKISDGSSTVLFCQILELDENKRVQDHDVIARPTSGIAKKDDPDNTLGPAADCSEVVWKPGERMQLLTKTAILETRVEQGDTDAAIALAELTGEPIPLRQLASQGDVVAAVTLARAHGEWAPLEALAAQGDTEAAITLAREHGEWAPLEMLAVQGDPDAVSEIAKFSREIEEAGSTRDVETAIRLAHLGKPALLKSLAASGDYRAAHALADEFDDDTDLVKLGEEGDYIVAYELYHRLVGGTESSQFIAAWHWLCVAANAGYPKAQAQVGFWHRPTSWENWSDWNEDGLDRLRKAGVQPDNRIAYMWYTLAASNGDESALNARKYFIEDLLADHETTEAEQMARDWEPGDCPNAEHRLKRSGEGAT